MPGGDTPSTPSSGAVALAYILALVAGFAWLILLPGLASLGGNDPAGNGLAQAFAAFEAIILWALLAALTFVCWLNGRMPGWGAIAATALIPISGVAAIGALELLARPQLPPHLWPLAMLIAPPALTIAYDLWAITPPLRDRLPAGAVSLVVWGVVLALSLSLAPMNAMQAAELRRQADALAQWRAEVAATPADAPLWQWTRLLDRGFYAEDDVIGTIRKLDRRQRDAETMLARGDFPLAYLSRFDLDATPAVCETARAELRGQIAPLVPATAQARPYSDIAIKVDGALAAMSWLTGYGCACEAESLAWETMANAYRDPGFSVVELAELRDPKALGRTLRETPERFSQLSPQSTLAAWLNFADEPEHRDAALAGALADANRTAEAIAMLEDKSVGPGIYVLIAAIPALDLDPTPRLCAAALSHVRDDLSQVYRPTAGNPLPYRELLERLGAGAPLSALQWLAGHGCVAEEELSAAETVVGAYQDAPERQAMLTSLAALHRKAQ
jgi:hypothetical protein